MPAVVSLQPSLSWGQKKHENSNDEQHNFENNDFNFDFSTSTTAPLQLPTVAAAPTSPVHRLSSTHAQTSDWLLLFLVSVFLLLAVVVSSLRAVVRAERRGRGLTLNGIKHDRSFSLFASSCSSSPSAPLFQQKTSSQLQNKNVKSFSCSDFENYKTHDSPTDSNVKVNTQPHLQPQPPSETGTETSASKTTTSNDRTSRAFTPTSTSAHPFTPPFTAFRPFAQSSSPPSSSLPFPFTRPPVHAPFAFSIPFHSNPTAPPSTPSGVSRNYLRKVHSSVAPLEDEQGQQKSQRHRRIRVYHLQTPPLSLEETTMDESRRSSTTTTTTMTEDSNGSSPVSRPPPLPLSTSRFAFERPSFEGEGDGEELPESAPTGDSDDTIPFIHQPNPDYAGEAAPAPEAPEAPSVSVADGAVPAPSVFSEDELPPSVWGRHTQVYGGGVCLACLAAENDGNGQGGEYGASVPMEERR